MMFISTLVHIVEFLMLSLLGIMLYKLLTSYKKWKSVSSSPYKGGDRQIREVRPTLPENPDYLSVSKITVTEEYPEKQPEKIKPASGILNDYIGEFFVESKSVDLEPYRAAQVNVDPPRVESADIPKNKLASSALSSKPEVSLADNVATLTQIDSAKTITKNRSASDLRKDNSSTGKLTTRRRREHPLPVEPLDDFALALQALEEIEKVSAEANDDEFIRVSVPTLSPVILTPSSSAKGENLQEIDTVPMLKAFADQDSEGYITVSDQSQAKNAANTMSDKVVLAMLDEAKLVCAS